MDSVSDRIPTVVHPFAEHGCVDAHTFGPLGMLLLNEYVLDMVLYVVFNQSLVL